jgi:hypothetical protein
MSGAMTSMQHLAVTVLCASLSLSACAPAPTASPPVTEGEDADVSEPPARADGATPDKAPRPPEADARSADAAAIDPTPTSDAAADPAPVPRDGGPAADGAAPTMMPGNRVSLRDQLVAKWTQTRETMKEEGGMTVFTGVFEAGKIGGPQGHTPRLTLEPAHEYLFEYKVRFDGDFPFTRGGKLPGLAGGNAPTGCVNTDANGFSARLMWRQNGALIGYLYDQDQGGDCGNNITTSHNFKAGQWYSLKERVKLNTGRNHDGELQLWVDDRLVIDRKNMEYMAAAPANLINVVLFHSFFGGSTQDWAPARQCSISFAEPFATLLTK